MAPENRPIIAVTVGEPAGIGPEIAVQSALDEEVRAAARVCLIGERPAVRAAARTVGTDVVIDPVSDPEWATYSPEAITLVDTRTMGEQLRWGKISAQGGIAAFEAVKTASSLAMAGKVAAIATAPIHKESLHMAEVPYIDHTTMLMGLTKATDVMTMFQTGKLRVFFLTRHIALADVPAALTIDLVRGGIIAAAKHLQSLGFSKPRLAVAALNPHGGEHGLFGTEEEDVLKPAIADLKGAAAGQVTGPIPADAVFHQGAEGRYDGVLSLYHDQGHIAAKTLDFHGTVSFTLGLPYLRTSVDHGTAFDIAGRGIANPHGMKAAILAACEFAKAYRAWQRKHA